jgi:phage-related protein
MIAQKRLTAVFYRTPSGKEPVREWLWSLDDEARKQIGEDLRRIEFGWPIGLPLCRPMGHGLYELRSALRDRTARVFFVPSEDRVVVLHAFTKKSRETPKPDLELARERKRDWEKFR